jgi:hypothetical protein
MSTDMSFTPQLEVGNTTEHISIDDARASFQRNTDWWTVFACFDLPDFNQSPLWISKKTGVSVEEVVEALEGLSVLGLLTRENGTFAPSKGREFFLYDFSGKSKKQVIEDHSIVTQQILNDMRMDGTFAIEHCSLAANKEIISELYSDMKAAIVKAFQKSQEMKNRNDGVYRIAFTAVDAIRTKSSTEKGVQQ